MIYVSYPNPIYVAQGILKTPVRFLGLLPFQKPLANSSEDFPEQQNEEWEGWLGRPWLTTLALKLDEVSINLIDCIITVTQEKYIVSTPLQGRNGTIKEYIADGDYQIEVRASVQPPTEAGGFAPLDQYPLDELTNLLKMFRKAENLEVQSEFLAMFEIDSVVIQSYSFVQETHSNRQTFQATLLSDSAYEIKIKEDNVTT